MGGPEFEYRSDVVTKDPSKQNAVPYFAIGQDYSQLVIQWCTIQRYNQWQWTIQYVCPGAETAVYVKIRVFHDVTLLDVSQDCSVDIFRARQSEMSTGSGQIGIWWHMCQGWQWYWLGGACRMHIHYCGWLALEAGGSLIVRNIGNVTSRYVVTAPKTHTFGSSSVITSDLAPLHYRTVQTVAPGVVQLLLH